LPPDGFRAAFFMPLVFSDFFAVSKTRRETAFCGGAEKQMDIPFLRIRRKPCREAPDAGMQKNVPLHEGKRRFFFL